MFNNRRSRYQQIEQCAVQYKPAGGQALTCCPVAGVRHLQLAAAAEQHHGAAARVGARRHGAKRGRQAQQRRALVAWEAVCACGG